MIYMSIQATNTCAYTHSAWNSTLVSRAEVTSQTTSHIKRDKKVYLIMFFAVKDFGKFFLKQYFKTFEVGFCGKVTNK